MCFIELSLYVSSRGEYERSCVDAAVLPSEIGRCGNKNSFRYDQKEFEMKKKLFLYFLKFESRCNFFFWA